jgi:2-oxoglutarate dehydrogenase E1 component
MGRFLQLCADHNLRVVVPSTSAQWFHLLREQAGGRNLKPLIVMSPKSELYSNERSHSPVAEMTEGTFSTILRDASISDPDSVTRIILCSGKFFYELEAAREEWRCTGTALVRIEQLYPFPKDELVNVLADFPNLVEVIWAQEEDKNHGAWRFVREEIEGIVRRGCCLRHVARTATASGAHSSLRRHQQEQRRLVDAALMQR